MSGRTFGRMLCAIFGLFTVFYTANLAYRYFAPSYRTETVFTHTVAESCRIKAVAIRDEQVLTSAESGVFDYLCDDGDVILSTTGIANVYSSDFDLAQQNICRRCDDEIAVLKYAESIGGDILLSDTINAQIYDATGAVIDSSVRGDLSNLSSQRDKLQLILAQKLLASGKEYDFRERIEYLEAQKEYAASRITNEPAVITAGVDGYFCSITDGYETLLPGDPAAVTAADIRGVLDGTIKPLEYTNAVGKVQADYKWHLAAVVSDKDTDKFVKGASVTLNFGVTGATNIPAYISDVREEGSSTIVIITCGRLNRYLINLRVTSVDVEFKSFSGLKVSREAIRYVGQTEGVYVKSGNLVEFKSINKIYEDETYVLCSDFENIDNPLEQFDEVIVEGKDLYDGKIIV